MSDAARVMEEDWRYTYKDYAAWELAPGERFELIDGVAYAMAGPADMHQRIVGALYAHFYSFFEGKPCQVRVAPYDVRLFYAKDGSDNTVVQPDVSIICSERKLGKEGCRGAPDMVVEVLSPSNSDVEMQRKLVLYERAGVPEYWVVDPEKTEIKAYRLEDGSYSMRRYKGPGAIVSTAIPGMSIALNRVFAVGMMNEPPYYTYKDYADWELAPRERFELIDGVAYPLETPGDRHQGILMKFIARVGNFSEGKPYQVRCAPYDVRLFYAGDDSDDTVVQPDLVVICDAKKIGDEGCRGAPDLAVEVLSPSNTVAEMKRKLALYKRAGVQEYWLVDPENTDIEAYRLVNTAYDMRRYKASDTIASTVLPGLEIALDDVFAE